MKQLQQDAVLYGNAAARQGLDEMATLLQYCDLFGVLANVPFSSLVLLSPAAPCCKPLSPPPPTPTVHLSDSHRFASISAWLAGWITTPALSTKPS